MLWNSGEGSCPEPVFQAPPPQCSGETAVFTCKSHDSSSNHRTVWLVSEASAPYGGCRLLHYLWPQTTTQCGSFHVQAITESPDNCFVSEISVTATEALNDTAVTCYYVDGSPNEIRGSGILQVIGTDYFHEASFIYSCLFRSYKNWNHCNREN